MGGLRYILGYAFAIEVARGDNELGRCLAPLGGLAQGFGANFGRRHLAFAGQSAGVR